MLSVLSLPYSCRYRLAQKVFRLTEHLLPLSLRTVVLETVHTADDLYHRSFAGL